MCIIENVLTHSNGTLKTGKKARVTQKVQVSNCRGFNDIFFASFNSFTVLGPKLQMDGIGST